MKQALLHLHIRYINFLRVVSKSPDFNFWAIYDFEGFIRRFGQDVPIIKESGMQTALDKAVEIGYDLKA